MGAGGMTHERFEALAEAFGGDVARWPADAREAAALLMAAEPEFTQAVLAQAERLDTALDAWRPAPASPALVERIVAGAPKARAPRWIGWLSPAAQGAFLGAGLAAACAAGVMVGVVVSEHSSTSREMAVTNTLSAVSSSLDLEEGA